MSIDRITPLAFGLYHSPGVNALLVGSGVSSGAGIKTGWEITCDLIVKLAAAEGTKCTEGPEAWFATKYGQKPDYSALLEQLGRTTAERQQILYRYFEPTPDERDRGEKLPTKAHRAIADLVADGNIRVIITTNFDSLLEQALEARAVTPVVISTPEAVQGALPLAHQKSVLIKLNGDYRDTRIRNTESELAAYEAPFASLLDQILDEYGLIVCGWSAEWDHGLRAAIERRSTRRFSIYWTHRGVLGRRVSELAQLQGSSLIQIRDADEFFEKLSGLVSGLHQSGRSRPESISALTAVTKRFLSESKWMIDLDDLVHEETESAYRLLEEYNNEVLNAIRTPTVTAIFDRYRSILERLQAVLICGTAWGGNRTAALCAKSIERIGSSSSTTPRQLGDHLSHYPVAFLLYSAGVTAMAESRLESLATILTRPQLREFDSIDPLLAELEWPGLNESAMKISGLERHTCALASHFFQVLREPLRRIVPDDADYDVKFETYECVQALVFSDLYERAGPSTRSPWLLPGRHNERYQQRPQRSVLRKLHADSLSHPPRDDSLYKAGLFGGLPDRYRRATESVAKLLGP